MTVSIFSLDNKQLSCVFDYLQDRDVQALGLTSKAMYSHAKEELKKRDETLRRLFSSYVVTRTFNIPDLVKARFFLLGEEHLNEANRTALSKIIYYLSRRAPVSFLIEGSASMSTWSFADLFKPLWTCMGTNMSILTPLKEPILAENIHAIGWDNLAIRKENREAQISRESRLSTKATEIWDQIFAIKGSSSGLESHLSLIEKLTRKYGKCPSPKEVEREYLKCLYSSLTEHRLFFTEHRLFENTYLSQEFDKWNDIWNEAQLTLELTTWPEPKDRYELDGKTADNQITLKLINRTLDCCFNQEGAALFFNLIKQANAISALLPERLKLSSALSQYPVSFSFSSFDAEADLFDVFTPRRLRYGIVAMMIFHRRLVQFMKEHDLPPWHKISEEMISEWEKDFLLYIDYYENRIDLEFPFRTDSMINTLEQVAALLGPKIQNHYVIAQGGSSHLEQQGLDKEKRGYALEKLYEELAKHPAAICIYNYDRFSQNYPHYVDLLPKKAESETTV